MKTRVDSIMKRTVRTCTPRDTLNVPAQVMWEVDCGCVPVVEGKRVVGIVTDRDICMAAYVRGKPLSQLTVDDTMAKHVFTCRPDDDLMDTERVMQEHQVRRLPVVDDNGQLVGLVSLADIASRRDRDVSLTDLAATLQAVCRPREQPLMRTAH